MKRAEIKAVISLFLAVFLGTGREARAAETLGLEGFLTQVRKDHGGYTGSLSASEGAQARSIEGNRLFAPSLFANAQWANDQSPKTAPAIQGNTAINNTYSLGVSKLWDFGLSTRLSYNLGFTSLQGAQIPSPTYHDGKPMLELSLPIWGGAFGSATRAQAEAAEAAALASSQLEAFQAQRILAAAEAAYWRLVVARDVTNVQKENLERARKTVDLSRRRVNLRLADSSDLYQSEGVYRVRQLELQQAEDELRSASRAFNSVRGVQGDLVPETVESFEKLVARGASAPQRKGRRRDVEAAYQQARATQAGARSLIERARPSVELYSALALNGRETGAGGAVAESFETDQPTSVVGVRMTFPLDIGALGKIRSGIESEIQASDAKFARRVFEDESEWQDLSKRYTEAVKRFDLASEIERAQRQKYQYERDRQSRGKSTVFMVLQFEQDYAASQILRLRSQSEILNLVSQMRIFEGGVY